MILFAVEQFINDDSIASELSRTVHVFLFTSGDGKQVNSKMEKQKTSRLFVIFEKIGQPRNLIDQYDPTNKTTLNSDPFVHLASKNDGKIIKASTQ